MNAKLPLAAALAALAGLTACSSSKGELSQAQEHLRRGNYYLAYHTLKEQGANESDPAFRTAKLVYLMAQGQEAVFDDRPEAALEAFDEVLTLEPDNEVARSWRQKTMRKLASLATRRGDEHRASGELESALVAYKQATDYVPGFEEAMQGVAKVAESVKQKRLRAQEHYVQGVDALGRQLYGVTWYHMVNALELNPDLERARSRRDMMTERRIQARYDAAKATQDQGHFNLALIEYQELQMQRPELPGINERIAAAQREVDCKKVIDEAQQLGLHGEYSKALTMLEQAYGMTDAQQLQIADLMQSVRQRDLSERYAEARIRELEHDLEGALEIYKGIDEVWENFKDTRQLITDIETTLASAKKAFQRGKEAEAKGDKSAALEAYGEAVFLHPGFAEAKARLDALKGAGMAGKNPGQPETTGEPKPPTTEESKPEKAPAPTEKPPSKG